jgi:hypothetical protein
MAKKTPAQLVKERLALAAQEAARGNAQAAANYAAAAANIKGTGQAKVQAVAQQYAAAVPTAAPDRPTRDFTQAETFPLTVGPDTTIDQDALDKAALKAEQRQTAASFLRNMLAQYGMSVLAGEMDTIIKDTTSEEVMVERLRGSESYKQRFKGLVQLRAKGITDIVNEGQYLAIERDYRQVFREAGISNFLGQSGSQTEYDAIAKLVGDFSLSVNEVRDRVGDAQRIVAQTPQEVRDSFQRYYNVDPATLTAYVLDPTRTASEINRKANAAMIGGLGMQRNLEFGAAAAERIGSFLGGESDLMGTQAEPILGEIADVQRATGRLAQLERSTLTAEETALAQLDLDTAAKEKVKGLQSRERARFGGTGAFSSTALGGGNKI